MFIRIVRSGKNVGQRKNNFNEKSMNHRTLSGLLVDKINQRNVKPWQFLHLPHLSRGFIVFKEHCAANHTIERLKIHIMSSSKLKMIYDTDLYSSISCFCPSPHVV